MQTHDVTKSTATTTEDNHSSASKQHDADHAKNAFAVSGTSPTHGTSQSTSAPPTPDTPINPRQDVALPENPTFEDLCALDRRLFTLYRTILAIHDDGRASSFCANALWRGWGAIDTQPFSFENDLSEIVGVPMPEEFRAHPFLATDEAYDMVCRKLYDALPPCRNCSCVSFEKYFDQYAASQAEGGAR